MEYIVYIFAASFVFMALALMFTYYRNRHYGVFLLGITYGIAAVLAVVVMHWWPLVAGFVLVWLLRLLGLDPDTAKEATHQSPEGETAQTDKKSS